MDHQPPPFFKRGPAPLARLSFYAALSLSLIFIDSRVQTLELLRQSVSFVTQPLQQLAHAPAKVFENAGDYFSSISRLQDENARIKRAQLDSAEALHRTQAIDATVHARMAATELPMLATSWPDIVTIQVRVAPASSSIR